MLKFHYVRPPKGVTFRSEADAKREFEEGQLWQCIGHAFIDDKGKAQGVKLYKEAVPARYTENELVVGDDDHPLVVPKLWALVWAPGRVAAARHVVRGEQRTVSIQYGKGRMVDLLNERATDGGERPETLHDLRGQRAALRLDQADCGGFKTSGGPAYTVSHLREVAWLRRPREEAGQPVHFDSEIPMDRKAWDGKGPRLGAVRRAGDRELEKQYWSMKCGNYNAYARNLNVPLGGAKNSCHGSYVVNVAPDSDHLTDAGLAGGSQDQFGHAVRAPKRISEEDKVGNLVGRTGHFVGRG